MDSRVTRQTSAPLEEYSLTILASNARELARLVRDGTMTVAPPYQRTSVWDDAQRVGLVESWCRGVPIPAVIINDRAAFSRTGKWIGPDDGFVYALVDGRQRIETAMAWFFNELAVPASWFPAEGVERTEQTSDGPYVRFEGLSLAWQRGVAFNFKLPRADARLHSVQEEAALYLLINSSGTAQTAADLDNARQIAEGVTR